MTARPVVHSEIPWWSPASAQQSFTGVQVPTELALAAVILVAIGSVAIRYLIQQRRG